MTTKAQLTIETYKNTSKSLAFLAFKQDCYGRKDISFAKFCEAMDIIIRNDNSTPINPITKKK